MIKVSCRIPRTLGAFTIAGFLMLLSGCETGAGARISDGPLFGSESIDTTYRPGDKIIVDFADNATMPPSWPQTVREDGTITLPLNQTVVAAGKRKGELEKTIHDTYIKGRLLKRVTVNIRADERTYFVTGEVKNQGQRPHTGSITAMQAIGAAGGFTDFANKSKVEVVRVNGEKLKVNGKNALKDPSKDVPVYPGDRVHVHRRYF